MTFRVLAVDNKKTCRILVQKIGILEEDKKTNVKEV